MEKLTLQNRKGQKIVGVLSKPEDEIRGTCVVQHGWSGRKEQPHMLAIADAFLENGFQTFNFDTTNSFNESDGEYEKSTLGLHYEDFEDVVAWVKQQDWFVSPLALAGHSKGGYSAARYAEEHPDEVALTAPIAPVVSGALSFEAHERSNPDEFKKWKEQGFLERESSSTPGLIKRSMWSAMEERLNHDLLPNAKNLTMPVFLFVGTDDEPIPPDHVQKLFDAIPEGMKHLEILEGAPHTYREPQHLAYLKEKLSLWLQQLSLT